MPARRALVLCAAAALSLCGDRASAQDAIVDGAAQFLIDRAGDNYLYVFERRLATNAHMQKYFPNTLRVARTGDLRALLMNKKIWRESLEKDLKAWLEDSGGSRVKEVLDVAQSLCDKVTVPKSYEGVWGEICGKVKNTIRETRTAKSTAEKKQQLTEFAATLRIEGKSLAIDSKVTAPLGELLGDKSAPVAERLSDAPSFVRFDDERALAATKAIIGVFDGLRRAHDSCDNLDSGSYTLCAVAVVSLLETAADGERVVYCKLWGLRCEARTLEFESEDVEFADFRRYVVFFAQVADAEDAKTVTALLKTAAVPSVSFGVKREPHRWHALVTGYLGASFGIKSRPSLSSEDSHLVGVSAPIGIEVSRGTGPRYSWSLLVSPIDLGYPVNVKLRGVDVATKASDVVVPGGYVFWGLKDLPIALGLGYTRGKSVDFPDTRVTRLMFIVAFDMPLFVLH